MPLHRQHPLNPGAFNSTLLRDISWKFINTPILKYTENIFGWNILKIYKHPCVEIYWVEICWKLINTPVLEYTEIYWKLDNWRLKYTEVQSQQMTFTQSPSVSNNPKIPSNYLIFAVIVFSLGSLEVCREAWCTRNSDFDEIRLFSYLHCCSAHSLLTRSGL